MAGLILERKLYVEDLFSGLNSEDEKPKDRCFEVRKNSIENILEGFRRAQKYYTDRYFDNARKAEEDIPGFVPKDYSSKDIEYFSIFLPQFQHLEHFSSVSGKYLSALINGSDEKDFKITVPQMEELIGYIGINNNGKSITINGNVGCWVGAGMNDGIIIVNGNVSNNLGQSMQGGKLIINGDAGHSIGFNMYSGEIQLNGNYKNLSDIHFIKGGNIYHRGKPILRNGKRTFGKYLNDLWRNLK